MSTEVTVEEDGNLVIPKEMLSEIDIKAGERIIVEKDGNLLILKKNLSLRDLLKLPKLTDPQDHDKITQDIREEKKLQKGE